MLSNLGGGALLKSWTGASVISLRWKFDKMLLFWLIKIEVISGVEKMLLFLGGGGGGD